MMLMLLVVVVAENGLGYTHAHKYLKISELESFVKEYFYESMSKISI